MEPPPRARRADGPRPSTTSLFSQSTRSSQDRGHRRSWITRIGLPRGSRHRSFTQSKPLPEWMQAELQTFLMVESLEQLIFPKTFDFVQPDGDLVQTELFSDLIPLMKVGRTAAQ